MAKSLSKTPAPKKDRIFGSDKNKEGSASSKASAKGIDLNDSIIETLTNKAKEYNEKHPNKKVSVATLKAVMRRGMGAYSTSHRPTITGGAPNSRQAWGFARVNKFLKKKAGQQVKAAYVQDDDLMADGGNLKEFKIDGKDATFEDFKNLYLRESVEFRTFDLNPKKVEYFGDNEQNIRYVKEYNYIISPFRKDGLLKDNYMKAKVLETYLNVPFRTFASSFRKHIDPYFKASNTELKKGRTFNEVARYVINDGGYYIDESKYRAFAKDFNIEIPTNDSYADGGETKKIKDAYTLVGVYESTNELGREESEDLTKEGLIGYRLRYNKMPKEYYGYATYGNTESDLETAKRFLERYNQGAAAEKERKRLKDIENKIKREKQKIIDAQKLEAAKADDSPKPAYLMTISEYQDRVVPLLKEYEKFARKNSEYLSDTSYNDFYKVTFEQVLSRGLEGKKSGYYYRKDNEKDLIEDWNERKFRKYENQTIPKPTPKDVLEKNISFFKDLNKFFDEKVIFDGLKSEYKKSNKPEIRRAIEDDTYKKLIENGEITEEQVIEIAGEHGIKVPKKVFSQESLLKKEAKKQMDEVLSKIPKMNQDVFVSLYKQLFEDFKDVEKIVIERETERFEGLIKEYIELSQKEGGVNVEKLQTAIVFWKDIFIEGRPRVVKTKDYRDYPIIENFYKDLELKSNYKPIMDKIILDYAESLKYRFLKAVLDNFPRVSKPISNISRESIEVGKKGFEGRYRFNFSDGSYFDFVTEAIPAAGYNIVAFHYRYITHLENATLADGTKVKGYYEIMQNFSSDSMADGGQTGQAITCVNCGWHWNTADSDESDKYICHKCGFDNRTFYDPEPIGKMADGGSIYNPKNIQVGDYVEYNKWYYNWVYTIRGKVLEIIDSGSYNNINQKIAKAKILIETKFGQTGALPHQKTTIIDVSKLSKIEKMADGGVMGQELFKPSKTIEQIAKEKDVPLDYAEEQLRKGMKTESEHSDNPMVQETIALQHLDEMIDYYEKLEYMESQNKMAEGDLLNKSLFNKALIYKSIKPIREANEMMERLDYMESQNKMANGGVTKFYKEYLDWYIDGVYDKMTIMVSVPNALSKMSGGDNDLILDVFEKKDESVNAKEKMKELLEIVDRNELDVYLEPIPRLYNIKDKSKREKITREYLIKYYENFGFELLPNGFMVRKNNKMEKGGQTISSTEKLISYLKEDGVKKEGTESIAKDGTKYRHDRYSTKGESANNWIVALFEKAAQENGNRNATRFAYKDTYSVAYDRPKYKGESNGKIIMTELVMGDNMEKGGYYKSGGEINPDNKAVKDYFSHGSGNVGGVLVGKRHSEGGIKAVNKSTNQPLEMEGGEVVITRNAVSDNTKREFNGEMLTNREILSKINESGGGVSFADGGDIPETISTSGKEYKYGGKMMKDHEIVSSCGCNHSMAKGGRVSSKKIGGGIYEYKGFYISRYDGTSQTLWNIYKDSDLTDEYAVGYLTKKDAMDSIDKSTNNSMAEGGETDYHTEIKNHLFPKVEVEVEVELEPEMDVMPNHEHYVTADDLGLSEGMPMLAVGTIVYSSGGNDQWEVVSFSDDGVNLVNNPKSPLQSKMEDKHLTFEELIKYFKDKAISIKNISTERELEPAIALVKNKLPQKSFAVGGLIDGDEDEDAKIMQSQFGKSNFK